MKHKIEWIAQPEAFAHGKGFTLIELLIAVGVLAILAAIAIPSYTQHVVKSNRAEAKTILMQTAQALERCYSRFSTYTSTDCTVSFPVTSEAGHYQIAQPASDELSATAFTLTAAPQGTQESRDTKCGDFTLTHSGIRDVTGSADADECW